MSVLQTHYLLSTILNILIIPATVCNMEQFRYPFCGFCCNDTIKGFCTNCLYKLCKLALRMDLASGDLQIRSLVLKSMVDLITIRYYDTGIIL